MKSLNILIADDRRVVREGIKSILSHDTECTVQDTVANPEDIFSSLQKFIPNLLILNTDIPRGDGAQIVKNILEEFPTLKILAITRSDAGDDVKALVEAGALGILLSDKEADELINGLRLMKDGKQFLSRQAIKALANHKHPSKKCRLTNRELEVLTLICEEYTNKEIAQKLNISVRTVDAHRRNILQKTNSNNTAGLVTYAIKYNLYQP